MTNATLNKHIYLKTKKTKKRYNSAPKMVEKFRKSFVLLIYLSRFSHLIDWWHLTHSWKINISSRPKVFCKKRVLRNFTKFTGKHPCQSLFFNSAAGFRPATLFKKRLAQVLSCEFCEISKKTFFTEHLGTTASLLSMKYYLQCFVSKI